MVAVFVFLLVVGAALWAFDHWKSRRRRMNRLRGLEKQAERRDRQKEIVRRQVAYEAKRAKWVDRFVWGRQEIKQITYQPPDADDR